MPRIRLAYMPLATFPEPIAEESVLTAVRFGAALKCALHVTTFAVDIPQVSSALGNLVLDIPGLVRAAEEKSEAECSRLQHVAQSAVGSEFSAHCSTRQIIVGAALDAAAVEARSFDLSVLPWSSESVEMQDMAQAVIFGSGRPTILVPPSTEPAALKHLAIAWDGSRVAARALGDALPLLSEDGRVSVLTVQDEKPLDESDLAGALPSALKTRGYEAAPVEIALSGRTTSEALQDAALSEGAQVLAMGGFGHSRIRDFVLGGATRGVLTQLRIPTLLSH